MDIKKLILERCENTITTREKLKEQIGGNPELIDSAVDGLLSTDGAYMIHRKMISFVYKQHRLSQISGKALKTAEYLSSVLPESTPEITDFSAYEKYSGIHPGIKPVFVTVSGNPEEAEKHLRKDCADVICGKDAENGKYEPITDAPVVLLSGNTGGKPFRDRYSFGSAEKMLYLMLAFPSIFGLTTKTDKTELIRAFVSEYRINYSIFLGLFGYRHGVKMRKTLLATPEYAFLIKRMRELLDDPSIMY